MKVETKILNFRYAIHMLKKDLPLTFWESRGVFNQKDLIALEMESIGEGIRRFENWDQKWSNHFFAPSDDKKQLALQILSDKLERFESKVLESFMN